MVFSIVLQRMVVFLLIVLTGVALCKFKVVKQDFMGDFSGMITKVFLPCLIFYMTYSGTTMQDFIENWPVLVFAACFYVGIAVVMWAVARIMRPTGDKAKVFRFAFIFGNTAFVAIPLLSALYGQTGMIFMAVFSLVDQLVFWTYGVWLATGSDRIYTFSPKKLLNPNIIAMLLAVALVFLQVPLPSLLVDTLGVLSNATSACCMLYLGFLFYFSNWLGVFKCKEMYAGIAVKMVLIPVIVGKLLLAFSGLPQEMIVCMIIVMALPVMTVVPMIAKINGNEGEYAAGILVVTLAVSVVTIPLVVFLTCGAL